MTQPSSSNRRPLALFEDAHRHGLEAAAAAELQAALWERSQHMSPSRSPQPARSPGQRRRVLPEPFVKQIVGLQRLDGIHLARRLRASQLSLAVTVWSSNAELYALQNKLLRRTFLSYLRSHAKTRRATVAAAIGAQHWVASTEASALVHMLEAVDLERRASVVMRKAVSRWLVKGMRGALSRWRDQGKLSGYCDKVHLSAAVILAGKSARAALSTWRAHGVQTACRLRGLEAAKQRFSIRWLAGCMFVWLHHTHLVKQQKAVMKGILLRMLHKDQSTAFLSWKNTAADRKWLRFRMRQALLKIVLGKATQALRTWCEICSERRRQAAVTRKVMLRIIRRRSYGLWDR